ncbi:MAG: hypothetical protein M1822_005221 [Bathelium mastoideum]|nr:MAG: hypothetical protein M1822_005221 [Bathelium mastoideum]
MASTINSQVVTLRRNGIAADSAHVPFREIRKYKDLHSRVCDLFIKDKRAYELDLHLVTSDGREPIDSVLWDSGFYVKKFEDNPTSVSILEAHLSPIEAVDSSDSSSCANDNTPATKRRIGRLRDLEARSNEPNPDARTKKPPQQRNADKSAQSKESLEDTEMTRDLRQRLELSATAPAGHFKPFQGTPFAGPNSSIGRNRVLSRDDRRRSTGSSVARTSDVGWRLHSAEESSQYVFQSYRTRNPALPDLRGEQYFFSSLPRDVVIKFFFFEHFTTTSSMLPAPNILSKPVPPLELAFASSTKEIEIVRKVQAHFEEFSGMRSDSVRMGYHLEMHGKIVVLGNRNWTLTQYMESIKAGPRLGVYTHRCTVVLARPRA